MTITGIYALYDLEDVCLYVGQSRDIGARWKRHLNLLKSNKHVRRDLLEWFKKNGSNPALMKFRVLEEMDEDCTEEQLNNREIEWFNLESPLFYGKLPSEKETWSQSEETKRKISAGLLKYHDTHGRTTPVVLICQVCGESFNRRPRKIGSYCSNICSGRARSKLTKQDEEEIRSLRGKLPVRAIAAKFGVSHPVVLRVLKQEL